VPPAAANPTRRHLGLLRNKSGEAGLILLLDIRSRGMPVESAILSLLRLHAIRLGSLLKEEVSRVRMNNQTQDKQPRRGKKPGG
jgi:hypothetical protein